MPKKRRAQTRRRSNELFWAKVLKPPHIDCWLWTAARQNGYGVFNLPNGATLAHRHAWRLVIGPIPRGKMLLHSCDIRACVNPAHLRLGTAQENADDKVARSRQPLGERCWNARLSEKDVRYIKRSTKPSAALARHFGVVPSTITQIRTGRNWNWVK